MKPNLSTFSAKLHKIYGGQEHGGIYYPMRLLIDMRFPAYDAKTGEIVYVGLRNQLTIDKNNNLFTASRDKIHYDINDTPSRVNDSEYELAREHPTDVKCHCYDFEDDACGTSAVYSWNAFDLAREIAKTVRENRKNNISDEETIEIIRKKYC